MSAIKLDGNGFAATWGEAVERCAEGVPRVTVAPLRVVEMYTRDATGRWCRHAFHRRTSEIAGRMFVSGLEEAIATDSAMRLIVSAAVAEGLFGWLR